MPKKKTRSSEIKKRDNRWTVIIVAILTVFIGVYLLARYGKKVYPPQILKKVDVGEVKGRIEAELKEAVEELIKGPAGKMVRTIPEGTRLLNVSIRQDTAFLDFSKDISERHPGGSSAEIQTVYSIVNTVAFNFPDIKNVQILIYGKKEKTLAGHIDISLPLKRDKTK